MIDQDWIDGRNVPPGTLEWSVGRTSVLECPFHHPVRPRSLHSSRAEPLCRSPLAASLDVSVLSRKHSLKDHQERGRSSEPTVSNLFHLWLSGNERRQRTTSARIRRGWSRTLLQRSERASCTKRVITSQLPRWRCSGNGVSVSKMTLFPWQALTKELAASWPRRGSLQRESWSWLP